MSAGTSFRLAFPRKRAEREIYDCVVVGAGPAGLTAAIYLARFGLKTIVVTKDIGGKMAIAPLVDDYPGIPEVPGSKLTSLFEAHVRKFGVDIVVGNPMENLRREGDLWCVETVNGDVFCGYAVIIAIGCEKRKLGVPGEDRLVGKGVSYCAVCDAHSLKTRSLLLLAAGTLHYLALSTLHLMPKKSISSTEEIGLEPSKHMWKRF